MWKACRGATNLFSFSNLFFPIFFYILSLVSRRCGWGRSFNVWNSSFRSKNGELGRSVGVWNWLSAPWTCLFRQLKIVHGANQREPRVLFSVKNDGHQSPRRRQYSSSVRVQRSAGHIGIPEPEALPGVFLTPAGGVPLLRHRYKVFSRMPPPLGPAGLADSLSSPLPGG